MTFISTPNSKSDLFRVRMSAPPPSIITLTIISLMIAISMMVLSVINIEVPSMWSNISVASLDVFYHIGFLIVVLIYRNNFSSASEHHTAVPVEGSEDKAPDYFEVAPLKASSIAFSMSNIISLLFLLAVNFIAFSVMANDTTVLGGGAASDGGNPVKFLKLRHQDFKIQLILTVILGCELLSIAATFGISAWGRRRMVLEEENNLKLRIQEPHYQS